MTAALKSPGKYLIEEQDVETRPEKVPDAILDENEDVHLIRRFFSNDAWLMVREVVKQKQETQISSARSATMTFTNSRLLYVTIAYPGIT